MSEGDVELGGVGDGGRKEKKRRGPQHEEGKTGKMGSRSTTHTEQRRTTVMV